MAQSMAGTNTALSNSQPGQNFRFALIVLTSLFFMWGFITSLNDILIPHLKNVFQLNYTQAMMIQFCFFFAYFVCSVPSGNLVKRIGYQLGIVFGLLIAACGCLLFIPASIIVSYPLFLGALFILASGITLLQVSANPYVTLLGKPELASSRLNLTQAFNSLGATLAPYIGGLLIFSEAMRHANAGADAVRVPYMVLAGTLVVLAIFFSFIKLPKITDNETQDQGDDSIWKHKHLVLGAIAIFVYVGAEVAIGSFMINFFGESSIGGMEEHQAAIYVTYYWGLAMIGRFVGFGLMRVIPANIILTVNALGAVLCLAMVIMSDGMVAVWALVLVGLCNSIMFPTIFSLGIARLGGLSSKGSGLLCLAIVGGAIIPLCQGVLADNFGLQMAFLLPLLCYAYIIFYGAKGYQPG